MDRSRPEETRPCPAPDPLLLTSPTTAGNSKAGQMTRHIVRGRGREEGDEDDRDADVDKPFPRHCMTLQGGMMTAVDVRRPNSHHVVTARILCNSLKVTPRERIKVSRCTNVCHLLQGRLEDVLRIFPCGNFV